MEKDIYTLRRYRRSKKIRLIIKNTGQVIITAPYLLPKKYIDSFFKEKQAWVQDKIDMFKSMPQPHIQTKRGDYKKYKQEALKLVETKIEKINLFYKFKFNKISIRNQKTRWGSCSSRKNLNFNYKIVFLPDHLAEYIVTHELCHIQEMNHGAKFWHLIAQTIPEYKECHTQLKNFKI